MEEYKNSLKKAAKYCPDLLHYINKVTTDLNPLKVLNLFEEISDEVIL